MNYAFICEFGTLKFDVAQTKRQIYYRSDRENCYLKQLLPKKGGYCKINFFSIVSLERFEYANLSFELKFKVVL